MSLVGSSIAQPSAGAGRAQLLASASMKGGPSVVWVLVVGSHMEELPALALWEPEELRHHQESYLLHQARQYHPLQ